MSQQDEIDQGYLDAIASTSSMSGLAELANLAEQQVLAEITLEKAEAALAKAKSTLADIAERRIPELMETLTLKQFKTTSGLVVELTNSTHASIPKGNERDAFSWLREKGHGALISNVVAVSFGRGEDGKAIDFMQMAIGQGFQPTSKVSVHPQTLSAFVREQLRNGKEVPMDLLGVHQKKLAKISIPSKKKG